MSETLSTFAGNGGSITLNGNADDPAVGGSDNVVIVSSDAAVVSISADGALNISGRAIDFGESATLSGAGVTLNATNTSITLSGADATTNKNTITSTGDANTISLTGGGVVVSPNNPDLILNSQGSLVLTNINIGDGTLTVNVDTNNNGTESLTIGAGVVIGASGSAVLNGGTDDNDTLVGLGTDSVFALSATDSGTLIDGGESFGFSAFGRVDGGGGTDSLTGLSSGTSTWTIDADPTYVNGGTLDFTGIANLTGGTSTDDFTVTVVHTGDLKGGSGDDSFAINNTLTGSVDGEVGTADTLSFGSAETVTLTGSDADGFAGTVLTNITGGFDGINTLTGSGGTDTLIGDDAAATWGIDGTPTYVSGCRTLDFTLFENLTGGNNTDDFTVTALHTGDLKGGSGDDSFAINNTLTGSVDGEVGTVDTLSFGSAETVTLTGSDADGFAGTVLTNITGGFDGINTLTGSGGTDTLIGDDAAATWGIDGTPTYVSGGRTLDFTLFENLTGGNNTDDFTVTALHTGDLKGGSGDDSFAINNTLTGSVDGEVGTVDTLSFGSAETVTLTGSDADGFAGTVLTNITGGFDGINTLTGSGGTDTLIGDDAAATWGIDGTPTYVSGGRTLDFTLFENLTGGNNTDDFTVTVVHTGDLTGGDGDDTFDIDATLTGVIDGGANTDDANFAGVAGALSLTIGTDLLNLETVVGNNVAGTRLIGPGGGNTWTITPADQGTVAGLAFSAFPELEAGAGGDTFNFNVAADNFSGLILGGAGDDQFVFVDNATLSGSIDGRGSVTADGDVINLATYTSATNVTLIDADNAQGFDGTATNGGTIVAFDNISTIRGASASSNTLTGPDLNNAWTLTAAGDGTNDGTIVTSARTLNFFDFPDLTGRTGDDGFTLNGGTLSGVADGGGGTNTFTADNVPNTWALGLNGAGDVDGVGSFLNIDNAVGNSGTDEFTVNALFDGTIDGQGPNDDHLILNGSLGDTDTVLTSSLADGFTGNSKNTGGLRIVDFVGIDEITSSGNTDSLTGVNANSPWTINVGESGTVLTAGNTFTWNNFDVVNGGNSDDIFNIGNGFAGTIDGGDGDDTFNLTTGAGVGTLSGGGNGGTGDTIAGPDDVNLWTITALDAGDVDGQLYSQMENLDGGTADDTFTFNVDVSVAGIDGNLGTDELNFSPLSAAKSLDVGTLTNIERLVDTGVAGDELIGPDAANTWTISANGNGDINGILFFGWEDLAGGDNVDTFDVDASHTGNLAGGDGADVFNLDDLVVLTGNPDGGNDADIFTFDGSAQVVGVVTGGAGNDTFTFDDTGNISSGAAVSLDGGADTDTLDFQLYDDVQSITFAGGVGVVDRDGGGTPEVLTGTAANEFINIETIDGNDGSFFGPNQPNTWLIDARNGPNSGVLNEGTPDEVEFNNFTLIGGDDTDDFILASAGSIRDLITGGLGFNTLTTNNGADALITITGARAGTHSDVNNVDVDGFDFIEIDNVSGGNANDTFDVNVSFAGSISGQGGVDIFNLTQAVGGTVDGGGGGDIFNITNGQLIGTLTGGAGTDTIVGGSMANVWDVTADNAGSLNPGTANEQTFTSIESWTGNTLVDSFVFQGDFIIGGTLDGAGGTDLLDLSIYTTQTDATLTAAGGTDGFAGTVVTDGPTTVTGFDNMNSILGGAALPDQNELTGSNTVNDWQITGSGTVSTNGKLIAFDNFEELLLGGSDVDTFTLAVVLPVPAAALIIDGGGDSDVLIGLAGTNVWDITDAESGTVTNDGGVHDHMFSSIENLTGNGLVDDFLLSIDGFISGTIDAGAGVDILTGRDAPGAGTSWTVNADGAGSSDDIGAFLNVENLEGGSLVDTFSLTASGRMNSIDGGTGFDELIGDNESNTWTILVAGDSGSVVNPSDGTTNFVSIENLTGNAGLDVFSFADGGFLSGALDGGGGVADDISFANQTGAVDVTVGAVGGGIVGGGISNIESVTGNGGQSTLFGANTANTWTVDGGLPVAPNRGNVNGTLSFVDFNNLVGGSAVDTFHVTVAVDGSIDGGGGNDIFNLSAGTPDLDGGVGAADRVNITGSFSHNGVLAFEDVEIFDNTLNNTISTAGAGNGISIDGLGDDGNGTTQIGTAANPILTTISNLQITGATSGAFFTESTGVVLQGIDLGGGNTFNLTTTTGSITADSGIIDANTLVLNSSARIGFFSNPVDTTASVLNLTVGSGQGGFVESTSALDTDDIQLTGNGVPGQTFLVGGDSLTFDTTDLTLPVGTPLVTGLDVAGFSTINQIDVTNSSITTGGVDLQLVAGTDLNLQPGTTFNLGGGILGLGGNTTGNSAGDVLTVNAAGMNILGDTIFRFDTVNLNLPPNSIGGFSDVTFVPFALGTNVDVGGGTLLDAQNVAAFNGFNGGLNIGGVVDPVGAAADLSPGIAGDVVVTEPVTLGFGSVLTIAALGDLVVGEVLTAEQINLIALGDDGTASNGGTAPGTIGACGGCILDVGSTDVVITDSAVLVATNTIGTEENNLNVDIDNTLDFASGQDDISATLNESVRDVQRDKPGA